MKEMIAMVMIVTIMMMMMMMMMMLLLIIVTVTTTLNKCVSQELHALVNVLQKETRRCDISNCQNHQWNTSDEWVRTLPTPVVTHVVNALQKVIRRSDTNKCKTDRYQSSMKRKWRGAYTAHTYLKVTHLVGTWVGGEGTLCGDGLQEHLVGSPVTARRAKKPWGRWNDYAWYTFLYFDTAPSWLCGSGVRLTHWKSWFKSRPSYVREIKIGPLQSGYSATHTV